MARYRFFNPQVYGVEGLKTHAKITLVIRREGKQMKRYVHASTGNYNRKTATIYEDLTYFTADPKIGEDAVDLFNYLTGYSRFQDYNSLIVAPLLMRRKIMELIEEQAAKGDDGQIFIKCNSITDPGIIAGLYRASQAGCWVDIVVRGVCCLKPGVEGLSTNIRVRSIIGKYLEHSRIYKFGDGDEQQVYIGSADLMHRNISRRCEILIPITSTRLRARLDEIIRTCLYDEHLAWELKEESWTWVNGDAEKDTHQIFEKVYEHQVMTKTAKKKKVGCWDGKEREKWNRFLGIGIGFADVFFPSSTALVCGRRLTRSPNTRNYGTRLYRQLCGRCDVDRCLCGDRSAHGQTLLKGTKQKVTSGVSLSTVNFGYQAISLVVLVT